MRVWRITGATTANANGYFTYFDHEDPNNSNLLTSVRAQSSAGEVENKYYYDSADRLNKITHNGFDYTFERDGYGNTTVINAGTRNLIKNIFYTGNGNLWHSDYGNGLVLLYDYDAYDRVKSVKKNGSLAYEYLYDARGNLAKITDKTSGSDVATTFSYDIGDNLTKQSSTDGSAIQYSYDNMNRSTNTTYTFANQTKQSSYKYAVDNLKDTSTLLNEEIISHTYDPLYRETATSIHLPDMGKPTLSVKRSFVSDPSSKATTTLIDTYTNERYSLAEDSTTTLSQYQYTYDDNGNISTVKDKDGNTTRYIYDDLNQLVRTDDQKAGISTTYSYDVGGNITQAVAYPYTTGTLGAPLNNGTETYAYGDDNWKGLLTNYNGQGISYDDIGNPLDYRDGMSFTWEGKQLKAAVANGKNLSYTYNSNGIRTSKAVDGITTNYLLDGSTIMAQKTGSNVMWFMYDSDGTRVGFTYNGVVYHYTTNAQGDVTGITDVDDTLVVEYSYDAWGKLLSTTGSLATTIGVQNPFLYRGYYYDSESGLYYLNSRYYDPQTGRMINADNTDTLTASPTSTTDKNLFSYCDNDPINRKDEDGHFWNFVIGAAVGATSVYVGDIVGNVLSGKSGWDILKPTSSVGTYLGAAASGIISGGGLVSAIGRIAVNTGVKHTTNALVYKQSVSVIDISKDLAINGIGEGLSYGVGSLLNKARPQNYSSFKYQMTRRIPSITQKQTKQVMYIIQGTISNINKALGFTINVATNR